MTTTTRTTVALLTIAGLGATAQADIIYEHSNAYVRADDEIDAYDEDFFGGPGYFSIEAHDGSQDAWVAAAPLSLLLDTYSGDAGVAFAVDIVSYFSLDADATMTVTWDFDASTRYEAGRIIFTNDDTSAVLLDVDFSNAAPDSVQIGLLAGTRYRVSANVSSADGAGSSLAHFVIPTPATGMVLGAALLLGAGRRRN